MQPTTKTIVSYVALNCWLSASITYLAWLSTEFGLASVAFLLLFPGFVLSFIFLGGGSRAYTTLRDYPLITASISFIIYSLIIGLVQRRIYKKRMTKK